MESNLKPERTQSKLKGKLTHVGGGVTVTALICWILTNSGMSNETIIMVGTVALLVFTIGVIFTSK